MALIKITSADGILNDQRKTIQSDEIAAVELGSDASPSQSVRIRYRNASQEEIVQTQTRAQAVALFTKIEGAM